MSLSLRAARSALTISIFCGTSIVSPVWAQITNVTNSTSTPTPGSGHDYIKMINETVNPANGSVSIRLGAPVPPGRGFSLPFSFQYDSNGALVLRGSLQGGSAGFSSNTTFLSEGGWSYGVPLLSANYILKTVQLPNGRSIQCRTDKDFVFQDPSGGRHALRLAGSQHVEITQCPNTPFLSGGDDFVLATMFNCYLNCPVKISDNDGTVFSFDGAFDNVAGFTQSGASLPTSIEDRNGNKILVATSSGTTTFTDTAGRSAVSFAAFGTNGSTASVSGLSSPYTVYWGTAPTNFGVNPVPTTGVPENNCSPINNSSASIPVISSVAMPNGKSYQFTYDSTYGMLNQITYPSGGWVKYSWALNPKSEVGFYADSQGHANSCEYNYDWPAIQHRYVSFDGTNIALQQDFSYAISWAAGNLTWTTKQTVVTTHDCARNNFNCTGAPTFTTTYSYSPVTPPLQPYDLEGFAGQIPVESTVVYADSNGTTLKTVTKVWGDAYKMTSAATTLPSGQVSQTNYSYGQGLIITDKKDWDWGQAPTGTPARETVMNYQGFAVTPIYSNSPSIADRPCSIITYGNGTRVAETDYFYDGSATTTPCATPTTQALSGSGNYAGHDETNYGTGVSPPRGNATTVTKQCFQGSTACTNSVSTYTFDETGQVLSMTDACGNATCSDMSGSNHTTSYSYTDNFDSNPSTPTNAYLTQITNPLGQIATFKYAYADGQLISSTDPNSLVTSYLYADSLRRLTETDRPDGGKIAISYNDTAPSPTITTSQSINGSQSVTKVTKFDGAEHTIQTQLTSDQQGIVYVDKTFDGLGRVWKQSNPYRSGNDPTTSSGTATLVYDALSRKTSETEPDGSVITSAYCGPNTLVTDPTGRWRRSRSDALGHLVEVDEPNAVGATVAATGCPGTAEPIWVTSYSYDVLNNLLQVVQNGSHQRTFTYDSLSRMLTSNNPEVGTLTYTYDANGNVSTKQDARSITTTYGYDVLNREKSVTYSNSDPAISINYDEPTCLSPSPTPCQNVGQRTSMTDAAGSESWSYHVDNTNTDTTMRTVHVNKRTTSSITNTSAYYLDQAGNLAHITYPTGRVVNYTFDNANRPKTAADGSNGITYATDFQTVPAGCLTGAVCYTPQGTFYALSIGQSTGFTGLNLTHTYNNRLQPNEFKASSTTNGVTSNAIDISYCFYPLVNNSCPTTPQGGNNGIVTGITNNLDPTRSQTFTYDQVNRITSALTTSTHATSPAHCWGETYTLDAWANLNSIAATTDSNYTACTMESGFSTTADGNNHLPIFGYDLSGNTQSDGFVTNYQWDAESQLKSAAGVTYTYDGDGRRVSKVGSKFYWYGSGGDILAETDTSGAVTAEYIFFGGKRIAMIPAGGNPTYYVEDMLGTSRVLTTNTGVVCYDADFYPYGGERTPYTNNCPTTNNYKFEGKERDTETGNDDFGARYYSNRFGRWLSADWSAVPAPVPYANLTNPQTLNLYAMVSDDPESFADLDGHDDRQPPNQDCAHKPDSLTCKSETAKQKEQVENRTWTVNYGYQITVFNSTTVITPNSDGTSTSTTTTTTATLVTAAPENGDNAGKFYATSQTETHTFVTATNEVNSAYTVSKEKEISRTDAAKVFGTQTLSALSSQATAPHYVSHFAHAVRHDPHALVHAGAATVGGVCLLTPCAGAVVAGAFLVESANFFWERMERK